MKALILAAGEGTRLRPLTLSLPKPMLPVGGEPLLAHLIRWLRHHGIDEIAINLHHRPEVIVEYCGDGAALGVSITYSFEERLLGSAGAVRRLGEYFDSTFLVVYGDMLLRTTLQPLLDLHLHRRSSLSMGLRATDDPGTCGMVALNEEGRITRFVEKPAPGTAVGPWANAGIYVVEPAIVRRIPDGCPCDFGRDLFPALLAAGVPMYGMPLEGYLTDIGSPETYRQALLDWASGKVQ